MKILVNISRILVGIIFIFSGFVKGVDPLGSTYKFIDYFNAFGIGFLEPIALPLAILLNLSEFIIGIALVLNLRMKIATWAVTGFMAFFTILTFVLAIFNPVSDCGCFGDAIKMTNWQTFYKNLIISFLVIILWLNRKNMARAKSGAKEWGLIVIYSILFFWLSIHSYRHLPIIDFRPYKTGTYIPDGMKIPEGAKSDVYETFLYYEKDGEIKEFTIENYPWEDTTWKFVDQKSVLLEKGFEPPIHDFVIDGPTGEITDRVLSDELPLLMLISHDLTKVKLRNIDRLQEIEHFLLENRYSFIGLTPSHDKDIENFKAATNMVIQFYNTDAITLKTIIRSNPGLVLMQKGTVLKKWHINDLPNAKELDNAIKSHGLSSPIQTNNKLLYLFFVFIGSAVYIAYRKLI